MKFVALKDLPQGQKPGDIFEATEAQGDVLALVGAARKYESPAPAVSPEPEDAQAATPIERPSRRSYRRRDLEAETDPR